jgi:hypothetical protein
MCHISGRVKLISDPPIAKRDAFKRAVTSKIRHLYGVIPHVRAGYFARFEVLVLPLGDVPVI